MGVSDRDYMHGQKGGSGVFGLTPAQFIWWLIGINAVVFLLPSLPGGWGYGATPSGGHRLGGYSSDALFRGEIWTLFTYQFVHASILHVALNMLGLYFLGRYVVQALGGASFLVLFLLGGVAGALFETAFRMITGQPTYIVGASAAVSAVFAMFVTLMPQAQMQIFPLPFLIRARTLLWVFLAFNGFFGIMTVVFRIPGTSTAYLAHCGGALYGLAHARYFRHGLPAIRFSGRKSKQPAVKYSTRKADPNIIDAQFSEVADGDYNAVLDKINRSGISSLTPRERHILEQASEKLSRDKR